MFYDGYHFWGMHLIWWIFWLIFIVAILKLFEPVSKNKVKKETPLEILQKRFASGQITREEYLESRKILEEDSQKQAPPDASKNGNESRTPSA